MHDYWPTKQFLEREKSPTLTYATMSQTEFLPQITTTWSMLLSVTRGIFVTIECHRCRICPNLNHVVLFVTIDFHWCQQIVKILFIFIFVTVSSAFFLSPLIVIDVAIVQILIMLSSLLPFHQPSFSLSLLGPAGLAQCPDLPNNQNLDADKQIMISNQRWILDFMQPN